MHLKSAKIFLFLNILRSSYCRPQELQNEDETTEAVAGARLLPTDQLLTNENSAALTAGALGLGLGVAGSLLVGKIIDDASRCRPPAITKFLPLPDLLNLNGLVNPECNKKYGYSEVRETLGQPVYPVQYPSAGYDTIPLSSQHYITDFTNLPVTQSQLTPDASYHQQGLVNTNYQSSGGFSETSSYIPSADNVLGENVNSPDLSHAATQHQNVHSINHQNVHSNNHQHVHGNNHQNVHSNNHQHVHSNNHQNVHSNNLQHVHHSQHSQHSLQNVNNVHELFPMEVNPAIQPRGLSEDEVISSPLPSAKKSALFSETGAVAATPDITFPDTNNGPREKRRDSSRSVSGFSETGAVVPEPDAIRFSVANQESRQGRVVETSAKLFRPVSKSSTFSETASVVPQPDQERGQEDRQGRVISSSQLFRPGAAKTSSFSETIPLVPGADVQIQVNRVTGDSRDTRHGRVISSSQLFRPVAAKTSSFSETLPVVPGAHVQIVNVNGRQDSRQGKVLQPDTSMFSSSSEFFTETEPVVALPDAERNGESRFQASEKIQESRVGRVLGPDMSLFHPQSSSFSETAAVVPEPDEARNERLSSSSAQTREEAERPVLFQPRPEAKSQRQGRLLHQEKSRAPIIRNEPKQFTVSPIPAAEPKKFSFGLN